MAFRNAITSEDQLPLIMNADEVAQYLDICRAKVYALMHAKSFPTIYIGKRMLVRRDDLFTWIESQTQ